MPGLIAQNEGKNATATGDLRIAERAATYGFAGARRAFSEAGKAHDFNALLRSASSPSGSAARLLSARTRHRGSSSRGAVETWRAWRRSQGFLAGGSPKSPDRRPFPMADQRIRAIAAAPGSSANAAAGEAGWSTEPVSLKGAVNGVLAVEEDRIGHRLILSISTEWSHRIERIGQNSPRGVARPRPAPMKSADSSRWSPLAAATRIDCVARSTSMRTSGQAEPVTAISAPSATASLETKRIFPSRREHEAQPSPKRRGGGAGAWSTYSLARSAPGFVVRRFRRARTPCSRRPAGPRHGRSPAASSAWSASRMKPGFPWKSAPTAISVCSAHVGP